jgi:hypothetical protein
VKGRQHRPANTAAKCRAAPRHTLSVAIKIRRAGDTYLGTVGPPEVPSEWATDRPYGRDELRWKIEALGAHPVDVADAVHAADLIRDAVLKAFRDHGVAGEIRVVISHDEAVFVLSERVAAPLRGAGLDVELQRLLGVKVWVTTDSPGLSERAVTL